MRVRARRGEWARRTPGTTRALALGTRIGEVAFVDAVSRVPRPMFPDLATAVVAIIAPPAGV